MTTDKPVRESVTENKFLKLVRKYRRWWRTRKMNGLGNRDWPDQLVVADKVSCFIEFKRRGEEPRETQQIRIDELRELGAIVGVFDDEIEAFNWVCALSDRNSPREKMDTTPVPAKGRKVHSGARMRSTVARSRSGKD